MEVELHDLNDAQRAAVSSDANVLQVLAPPGSGKTKTLTTRVAYLIAQRQMKPWNIITCTFTKKAANEMKERIRAFVGPEMARQIKLGTFHAIAVQYLKQYGHHIGLEKDFGIADSSDSKAILKRIISKHDFTADAGSMLGRISARKMKEIDSEQVMQSAKHVEQREFAQIFAEYEAELKASNLLDYDDLLLQCCFLLRTWPQCVGNVEAVLIDEFQDTNNVQYDLMGLFAQKQNCITIVGDPDQSIYGFRNAEIANLSRMRTHWPDTVTINLEENYRSSGAILEAAQNIIEQDKQRPAKRLQATHSPGLRPVLRKLPSAGAEAAWLVSEIRRMSALTAHVLKPNDFAILLRSGYLSRVIETVFGKEGMPYRMVGGVKFYDRHEVKVVLDYLRVVNQTANSEALTRVLNVPTRGVGDATLNRLREIFTKRGVSLWTLVLEIAQGRCTSPIKLSGAARKGLEKFTGVILGAQQKLAGSEGQPGSLVDVINFIVKKIDLHTHLKDKYQTELENRWANVEELVAQAVEASDPERLAEMVQQDALPDVEGIQRQHSSGDDVLSMFLTNVALTSSAEQKAEEDGEPAQQVTISTIHSAKGLEWPVVFIPACYDGSIPHSRSEDTDEERRLLYVGMTRAQAMLYLSCPVKNTQREETTLSPFLTAPGAVTFFEEHGPSMSVESAARLATTLRRDAPSAHKCTEGKDGLEHDEDNYWPLNGEEIPEELSKWNYGPASARGSRSGGWVTETSEGQTAYVAEKRTMGTGFVSVKDRYEEIETENRLKAIDDKRAKVEKKQDIEATKGRKRQIEGQATLAGFLAKRGRKEPCELKQGLEHQGHKPASRGSQPLSNISNIAALPQSEDRSSRKPSAVSSLHGRKPSTAPLRKPPASPSAKPKSGYMFLSSSPPRSEAVKDESEGDGERDDRENVFPPRLQHQAPPVQHAGFRPASTMHATSMQSLRQGAGRGKTYGVRPSFNGWANRMEKGK